MESHAGSHEVVRSGLYMSVSFDMWLGSGPYGCYHEKDTGPLVPSLCSASQQLLGYQKTMRKGGALCC